jgi:predicted outer membrane repeat protein
LKRRITVKRFAPFFALSFSLLALLSLLGPAPAAQAAGVVSACDEASLKAAISGGGTITFACNGTITLTSTITLSGNTALDGTGHTVTISGNNSVRLFTVPAGMSLSLTHLNLAGGNGGSGDGGAVHAGQYGTGGSTVTVSDCTFTGNRATGYGGAISAEGTGTVTVTNSTFAGNSGGWGGAIFNNGGTLSVTGSTFSGNSVSATRTGAGLGGAIYENGQSGRPMTVANSTFAGNSATGTGNGGAIYTDIGTSTVLNSTFSGNNATSGGGIYAYRTNLTVSNSLIVKGTTGPNCTFIETHADGANNQADDTSCVGSVTYSTGINLGTLGDYGGPTQTIPLLPGSTAIDAGDDAVAAAAPVSGVDQRGVGRPSGPHSDIGAYELVQADCISIRSGDWSMASVWSCPGRPGTVPGATDNVEIAGHTVVLDVDAAVKNLILSGYGGADVNGHVLTLYENLIDRSSADQPLADFMAGSATPGKLSFQGASEQIIGSDTKTVRTGIAARVEVNKPAGTALTVEKAVEIRGDLILSATHAGVLDLQAELTLRRSLIDNSPDANLLPIDSSNGGGSIRFEDKDDATAANQFLQRASGLLRPILLPRVIVNKKPNRVLDLQKPVEIRGDLVLDATHDGTVDLEDALTLRRHLIDNRPDSIDRDAIRQSSDADTDLSKAEVEIGDKDEASSTDQEVKSESGRWRPTTLASVRVSKLGAKVLRILTNTNFVKTIIAGTADQSIDIVARADIHLTETSQRVMISQIGNPGTTASKITTALKSAANAIAKLFQGIRSWFRHGSMELMVTGADGSVKVVEVVVGDEANPDALVTVPNGASATIDEPVGNYVVVQNTSGAGGGSVTVGMGGQTVVLQPETANVTATSQDVSAAEQGSTTVTLAGGPAGVPLTFAITALPANGTLYAGADPGAAKCASAPCVLPGNQVTYVGNANWNGTESFQFRSYYQGLSSINVATVTVHVAAVNHAPTLNEITLPGSVKWGNQLTFMATATDPDRPANTLTYSLVAHGASTVPEGATILATTGAFSWTPTSNQIGSHTFDVKVCDNGAPSLCDQKPVTVNVGKRETALTYGGDVSGQYSDPATLKATLADNGGGSLQGAFLGGKTVACAIGSQSASGSTGSTGVASMTLTLRQAATTPTVGCSFAGSDLYLGSSSSPVAFSVAREATALALTSSNALPVGSVTVKATLVEEDTIPLSPAGQAVIFSATPTGGGSAVTATGTVDATGAASAKLSLPAGAYSLVASFGGDSYYKPATSAVRTLYVYQPTQFIIWGGNPPIASGQVANVTVGQNYLFWGAQWAKQVKGGDYKGSSSFKGYADKVDWKAGTWSAGSGNSDDPPSSVPSYIGVIVATSATKNGSATSGNIAEIGVLKVDSPNRYEPDPGHPGSGVLVAIDR